MQPRRTSQLGDEVGLDLLGVTLQEGTKTTQVAGLHLVDAHTGVQVVWPIRQPLAAVEAKDVLTAFEFAWGSLTPGPGRFSVDQGSEFKDVF